MYIVCLIGLVFVVDNFIIGSAIHIKVPLNVTCHSVVWKMISAAHALPFIPTANKILRNSSAKNYEAFYCLYRQ